MQARSVLLPTSNSTSWSINDLARMPVVWIAGVILVFLISAANLIDVQPNQDGVDLDTQVLAKLTIIAAGAVYGVWGLMAVPKVRNVLFSFPGVWLTLILCFYLLSCLTAYDVTMAIASTGALLAVVLTTVTAIAHVGLLPVLTAVFYGMAFFVVGSWFAFFFVPEIGVFSEPLADAEFANRMGGLAHPNVLGQFSGLTVVIGSVLYFKYKQRSLFRAAIIILAAAALICSLSRTSLGATVLALLFCFRGQLFQQKYIRRYLVMAAVGMFALFVISSKTDLVESIGSRFGLLTKSGNVSELTTATGRVEIWNASLKLIAESPLTGYGPVASKYLLADYLKYTHNLVLNVALSTGVFGGLAACIMILSRLWTMLSRQNMLADGIVVFIIINGMFENVMFSILAGMPTMVWVIGLTWWSFADDPIHQFEHQESPSERLSDFAA